MSFVVAAPEAVQTAAQQLAGIRSTLIEASTSAGAPTTGLVAAAQDQVSASVAAMLGAFGQQYQTLSVQATAFHEQFVNLLNAGAAAYLATDIANAGPNMLNAAEGSVHGLFGQSVIAASGGAAGAVAASMSSAQSVALPVLGGATPLGPVLSRVSASLGPSVSGVVTALANGTAVSVLSGEVGTAVQPLSGNIAGLSGALRSLEAALAPGLLQTSAATGLATVGGPDQTLYTDTVANLQALGGAISANPAPFLHQFIANQAGYAQTIATGAGYVIQNLPAVLANLPANIHAAIQALLTINPVPYVQQLITNQVAYAQLIATSLRNAAYDFGAGLQALPAVFQSAFQALAAGNIGGAVTDIAQGFANLFVTGFAITTIGTTIQVTLTGALGDLFPILTIPGEMAQNFTNVLPTGSIPAQISQNFTNLINALTDTSITANLTATSILSPPSLNFSVVNTFGLPMALVLDAAGAPVNTLDALNASGATFVDALETGDGVGAAAALIDAPAVVANGFLNGQSTLPLTLNIGSFPTTLNLPMDGVLVPATPYAATINPGIAGTVTIPAGGRPLSGLATGLLAYAPEQLALAITSS